MRLLEDLNRCAKELGSWLPWTLPLKLILGALLGALGGAGVLGFLSEYATYSYALYFGFRPPLEGIPYLKASVTLLSFVLLVGAALAFITSIGILRQFRWIAFAPIKYISKWISRRVWRRVRHAEMLMRRRPIKFKLGLALLGGISTAGMLYVVGKSTSISDPFSDPRWVALSGAYGFVVVFCTYEVRAIRVVAWLSTCAYFCAWLYLLFTPSYYANFLRTVGYGGGLPVIVELREQPELPGKLLSGFLMLRTSEAMMIFMPGTPSVVEVPRDQIHTIRHAAGGLRNLTYRMPD